ncbi:MAG: dihydrolipoyl dehydrogenase family protein [Rhizomicrobium sp.]
MRTEISCDVCIIGAGSAGLSAAAGAARLGARTVLFERDRMGGDCLNTGCVPSKALLAAARAAHAVRHSARFGIDGGEPTVDFAAVMAHVRAVIKRIAPHDSVERFEGLGVKVIHEEARFTGPLQVESDTTRVRARRIVIATGSVAVVPPIAGLKSVPYLTNETIFDLAEQPRHLLIIGGGPIGVEMAQAFLRLGSKVTIIEQQRLLPRDEPELVELLKARLVEEGLAIHENARITAVAGTAQGIALTRVGGEQTLTGSHLLIAAGRRPRLDGLGLETAGITWSERGVNVDARLATRNKRVYALGDSNGGPLFTHAAGYQAGLFIRNGLFGLSARADYRTLPWVTYSDPELAHVGLTEAEARGHWGDRVRVIRCAFADNDRAQCEADTTGAIKIISDAKGRIHGVTILGAEAGELLGLWSLAMAQKLTLRAVAALILPYPTRSDIAKRAAGAFYAPKLFSVWPKRLVRLRLGRRPADI